MKDHRTLPGLNETLWRHLEAGVSDPNSPAHTLALATRRTNSGAARMIILRAADRKTWALTFYTHALSKKVAELEACPEAEVLMWSPPLQLQARLGVTVSIGPANPALWSRLSDGQRLNYAATAPGGRLGSPMTPKPINGPRHMRFLTAHIHRIDLLHLGALPHARAVYLRDDNWHGRWVAP